MFGRGTPSETDPDDWFADEDLQALARAPSTERAARPDDWLAAGEPVRKRGPGVPPRSRTLLAGGLLALVLLVIGLAAGGVFSTGGGKHPPATTTLSQQSTVTPSVTRPVAGVHVPTKTLKPGGTGAQVRLLQRVLAFLGYSPGAVDGMYGNSAKSAVSAFQRAHKLTVDGIAGPATLRALRSALAARG